MYDACNSLTYSLTPPSSRLILLCCVVFCCVVFSNPTSLTQGGYFRETYRSGAEPMASKGKTDPAGDLMPTSRNSTSPGEDSLTLNSSDNGDDGQRNVMTSMIFMATSDSPILYFGINHSDHVHYFHGPPGCSYTYHCILPTGEVQEFTLGSDTLNGELLQIVFPKGCLKAGHLNGSHCLIGEGVAPGFDFRDFAFCDEDMLEERLKMMLAADGGDVTGDVSEGGRALTRLMRKYVKYIKPDRRRNFDDYYSKQQ